MYNWDIKHLNSLLTLYQHKLKLSKNKLERQAIKETIESLEEAINYFKQNLSRLPLHLPNFPHYSKEDILIDDFKSINEFNAYLEIIKSFVNSFSNPAIKVREKPSKIFLSPTSITTLSSDFYQQFKGIFSDSYTKLQSNFKNRLNFRRTLRPNMFEGETFPILGTSEVYIDIILKQTYHDFLTMVHESAHGLSYSLNREIIKDQNRFCFREVDALFFELLGLDFNSHIISDSNNISCKITDFNFYLYLAKIIYFKLKMYSIIPFLELNNQNFQHEYFKHSQFAQEINFRDFTKTFIREQIHYIISYLTAVELYLIYKDDNELALDLLYKIITLKCPDNKSYLEAIKKLGIIPGQNIHLYYKELEMAKKKIL